LAPGLTDTDGMVLNEEQVAGLVRKHHWDAWVGPKTWPMRSRCWFPIRRAGSPCRTCGRRAVSFRFFSRAA
jgi:hypothetical protein